MLEGFNSATNEMHAGKIPVGISACLLGQNVRYNGSHKRNRFCTDTLSQYLDFVPLCPEVEAGMSVPRQPIRLVSEHSKDQQVRALGVNNPTFDATDALTEYAKASSHKMSSLCGLILMQKSPSCGVNGVNGVKRYLANGHPQGTTQGILAKYVMAEHPLLPIEEAGRLNDAMLRENFLLRVFVRADWLSFCRETISAKRLIDFHSRYKYLVMAHGQVPYKKLGQLLSNLSKVDMNKVADTYITILMTALSKPAKRKHHCNVMMHLKGYLKTSITSQENQEMTHLIEQYRLGYIPLCAPMTLLTHLLNRDKNNNHYAKQQVYLNPYPFQLGLRNHV